MSTLSAHSAAQNNQFSLLRSLVDENPKVVNSLDLDERTPLHWAASSGAIEIVRFLIDQKVEVDKPDISGWSPLHIAGCYPCESTWFTCAKLLLDTVSAGHEEVVKELVGAGADVNRSVTSSSKV
ncbi:hypothetical protein H0H93_001030 [Arthromyces matolae]|nr:hypothetical protein H0H93_001030 [Arthromyces matolae]